VKGGFEETVPRKTIKKRTLKHCNGGVGLMAANHRDGSES